MSEVLCRPYRPDDLAACLAIFDSNTPRFFAPHERAEFEEHLAATHPQIQPYLVLTLRDKVIACGGLSVDLAKAQASLDWGMVDRTRQGMRLGTRLTEARLAQARDLPGVARVTLATSQHTQGFYAGFGFQVTGITPDGFGPGLDRWDMALTL